MANENWFKDWERAGAYRAKAYMTGKCYLCGATIKRTVETLINRKYEGVGPPPCRKCAAKAAKARSDADIARNHRWLLQRT